jgi:polyisoprenoid-binding protein YceI
MKKITIIALLSFFTLGLSAQKMSKTSGASIKFSIYNAGTVNGKFKTVKAAGTFDPSKTENISLSGTAYVKSVFTDNSLRDKHLRNKKDFFNMAKTPTVTMKSYKVIKQATGKYTVFWKLTMRGITKNIKTTVLAKKVGSGYKLTSSFKINRNTWDLGGGGIKTIAMKDIVTVSISTMYK